MSGPELPEGVPPEGLLCLDPDVSQWLHDMAAMYFGGDVQKAMNHYLNKAMEEYDYFVGKGVDPFTPPESPWAQLEANLPPTHGGPPRPRSSPEEAL